MNGKLRQPDSAYDTAQAIEETGEDHSTQPRVPLAEAHSSDYGWRGRMVQTSRRYPSLNTNCSAGENTYARIIIVLNNEVSPDAANIMAMTTN